MKQKKNDNYNNCAEESKKREDESWEEYARRFLNWATEWRSEIQHSIKKNVTWEDDEFFNDIYTDGLIRIYNYIVQKNKEIQSWKMFTFTALKWSYIQRQNKLRAERNNKVDVSALADVEAESDWQEREDYLNRVENYLNWLFEQVNDNFDSATADTFIIYYRLKAEKSQSVSYRKLATICGVSEQEISRRIQAVKKWIKDNKEILEIRRNKMLNI